MAKNFLNMGTKKLLNIEPLELTFPFELGKQSTCIIRLSNNSREHVAFKVMTTSPQKYTVRLKNGVLSPQSSCNVTVTMHGPKETPANMQCKDKFLIKSIIASPGDTAESSKTLFNEEGRVVEDFKLRVLYVSPTHQHSSHSDRSGAGSSNASTSQERNLNNTEQDQNGRHIGYLFMRGITVVLLCLVMWFLIRKMLPLIWSLTFMITMLIIKMMNKLVADSVEDWIVKTLLYLCFHLFSVVFRRARNQT